MPRPTTAARRYAEAAFEIARRDATLDAWQAGLRVAAAQLADRRVARGREPRHPVRRAPGDHHPGPLGRGRAPS